MSSVFIMKSKPAPKSSRLMLSPLCVRNTHCGAKVVLGPPEPWADGQGHGRRIVCLRCRATGWESVNYENGGKRPTEVAGIVLPGLRVKQGRLQR